jgi:hypothetical protein
VGAIAAVVVLLCGCSGGDSETADDSLINRADSVPTRVRITGASEAQRRELRWVLAGMGESRVTSVHVDTTRAPMKGAGLGLDARGGKEDRRAAWEQMLLAAVFRDRSAERGLPRVVWVSSPQMLGGASIAYRPPLRVRLFGRADGRRVAARIRRAASLSGASLDQLILLQPNGLAPVIRLRVRDPVRFLRERYERFLAALDEDRIHYEGEFFELVDREGRPIWRTYGVARIHWGGHWARSDLASCWRETTRRPRGRSPAPCRIDR